jgi:hypothetical protein
LKAIRRASSAVSTFACRASASGLLRAAAENLLICGALAFHRGIGRPSSGTQQGAPKRKEFRMDWRRLVTDDATETDLLRSYVVRVTDVTFGYMAEQAAAESGVPTAEGRERMWTLFARGALRLVGPVTDDDRIGVEPCNNNEWHEQAKKNGPLVEWRRQMAAAGDKADDQGRRALTYR